MQGETDKFDATSLQKSVKEHFAEIKLKPYEMGTCKRVFRLSDNIGLAVTHSNSLMESDLIHDESFYLSYLKEQGYPVVSTHGNVFAVESEGDKTRYGYLMDYIPNAVFIETKSPALLKTQVFAALLGIPTQASEGWWALNHAKLLKVITTKLNNPADFSKLQRSAEQLFDNYNHLIEKLKNDHLAIADLQIMLSQDGSLTIIDPLDVVKIDPEIKNIISVLHPEKPPAAGFEKFLLKTHEWLNNGLMLCATIAKAGNVDSLKNQIDNTQSSHLSRSLIDHKTQTNTTRPSKK